MVRIIGNDETPERWKDLREVVPKEVHMTTGARGSSPGYPGAKATWQQAHIIVPRKLAHERKSGSFRQQLIPTSLVGFLQSRETYSVL